MKMDIIKTVFALALGVIPGILSFLLGCRFIKNPARMRSVFEKWPSGEALPECFKNIKSDREARVIGVILVVGGLAMCALPCIFISIYTE